MPKLRNPEGAGFRAGVRQSSRFANIALVGCADLVFWVQTDVRLAFTMVEVCRLGCSHTAPTTRGRSCFLRQNEARLHIISIQAGSYF